MTPPDPSPVAPVDTSAEAVARMVDGLRGANGPASTLLAAVVKEREEARADAGQMRADFADVNAERARWRKDAEALAKRLNESDARADTASRQRDEARAALDDLSRAVLRDLRAEGEGQAADARKRLYDATNAARALLSGETTR